jgi:hypothetical protein
VVSFYVQFSIACRQLIITSTLYLFLILMMFVAINEFIKKELQKYFLHVYLSVYMILWNLVFVVRDVREG